MLHTEQSQMHLFALQGRHILRKKWPFLFSFKSLVVAAQQSPSFALAGRSHSAA
jgi:hypothetical protein